ncbi:MAG: ribosome assembly factor SBDS [Candidatus Lokiarchaeota archaeon]|nr:ribosome assembly factor SBDS [Candidatus Lokiarchaeota archaeon]
MSLRSGGEKRVDLGKFTIARLYKQNKNVEMIVEPEQAWNAKKKIDAHIRALKEENENAEFSLEDLKQMPEIDINNIFEGFIVFEDAMRGKEHSDSDLEQLFGSTDPVEIAYQMLYDRDTEWQWTKKQRDENFEKKKRQIIAIIAKNCINPQTKKPHPPQRIEKAITEAKFNIDIIKSAEEQVKNVISAISSIIPIRMENIELAVKIPASYAAKSYNIVERYGKIKKDEWQNDGSWVGIVDLPAGMEAEFLDKINKLTHGRVQIKILNRS